MTDLVTSFIDVDDDFDMMQFHVSEDEVSAASDWPPGPAQVDWDWASKATSTRSSMQSSARDVNSSGFLNCWKEGPLPDIFNLDDDVLTPVPESLPAAGTPDSQSDDDHGGPLEMKRSPRSATSRRWTDAEITALKEAVAQYGTGNWKSIQADPRYSSLLGDRVRSSLHRKWSRIKAKSAKDHPGSVALGPSSTRPIPMSMPSSRSEHRLETSPSPFGLGSWSKESSQQRADMRAHSMPPNAFQLQWGAASHGPPPPTRTPSAPMGFQPGSAPHPVHMAVCVDPSAPPPSPFVPLKPRFSSTFAPGSVPIKTSPSLSGRSASLPKSHGFRMPPIGSPSGGGGFATAPTSFGPVPISQSVPRSHCVPDNVHASKSRRWTAAQAQVLVKAVSVHGESRWKDILNDEKYASFFAGRSPQSLVRKWNRIQSNSTKHLGVPLSEAMPGARMTGAAPPPQPPPASSRIVEMEFEDSFLS